jgi:serine/threonine protein kinase
LSLTIYLSLLSDFSGSNIRDEESLARPETRYEKQGVEVIKISRATDIFAIGSLIYEIVTGKPPYDELEGDEVKKLFKRAEFPSMANICLGSIIRGCWISAYETVKQVLDAMLTREGRGSSNDSKDNSGLVYSKIKTPKPLRALSLLGFEHEPLVSWHEQSLSWPELA